MDDALLGPLSVDAVDSSSGDLRLTKSVTFAAEPVTL
jgi:hypothetical protein